MSPLLCKWVWVGMLWTWSILITGLQQAADHCPALHKSVPSLVVPTLQLPGALVKNAGSPKVRGSCRVGGLKAWLWDCTCLLEGLSAATLCCCWALSSDSTLHWLTWSSQGMGVLEPACGPLCNRTGRRGGECALTYSVSKYVSAHWPLMLWKSHKRRLCLRS